MEETGLQGQARREAGGEPIDVGLRGALDGWESGQLDLGKRGVVRKAGQTITCKYSPPANGQWDLARIQDSPLLVRRSWQAGRDSER